MGFSRHNWLEESSTRDWFNHTLANTYPPPFSSSERGALKGVIEDEEKRIKELEKQIRESEALIQRTKVQISPVRLLPPEILSRIFLLVAGERFAFRGNLHHIAPMLVCKAWRDVAVSTPELWSKIDLCSYSMFYSMRSSQKDLELWLSRAKNVPLHVTCDTSAVSSSGRAWSLLLGHANAWGGLKFSGKSLAPVQQYFNSLKGQSMLEMLDLDGLDFSSSLGLSDSISFPKLSTLSIWGGDIIKDFKHFQAPYVRDLKMRQVSLSGHNLAMISTAFPGLRKLALESVSEPTEEQDENGTLKPELRTPELEHCSLSSDYKNPGLIFNPAIFRHCTSLESLSLFGTRFRACQKMNLPSVSKLYYMPDDPLSPEQSREFFTIFPSLKHFTLSCSDIEKKHVESILLSLGPSSEPNSLQLCSKLEKITFRGLWIDRATLTTFMETRQPKLLVTVANCWGIPDVNSVDHQQLLLVPEMDIRPSPEVYMDSDSDGGYDEDYCGDSDNDYYGCNCCDDYPMIDEDYYPF